MKYLKSFLTLGIAAVGLTSCNELDLEPQGSFLTADQRVAVSEANPDKLESQVAGCFAAFYTLAGSYSSYADTGMASSILMLESRSQDWIAQNPDGYGWYSSCVYYSDNTVSSSYNLMLWGLGYNTIYVCNDVLSTIDPETEDEQLLFYRAQALTVRAYMYHYLAQIYQFNYASHKDALCVPLITDENSESAAMDGAPRATVEEVYAQCLKDYNEAETCLKSSSIIRADKRWVDLSVVYGLRARLNLCMEEWSAAAEDAQSCINSFSGSPISVATASVPGFKSADEQNWIWGEILTSETTYGLYTFVGFTGSWSYGYAYVGDWKCIASNLWDEIPAGDVRKGWWRSPEDGSSIGDNYSATYNGMSASEYLDYVEAPEYAVVKFACYDDVLCQSSNYSDVPLMRVEEMYLILAEAQAMSGGTATAKTTLENFVNTYRMKSGTYSCLASTATGIQDEVWMQRRIELWGEGFSYFDCLRLNKPIDRSMATDCNENYRYYIPAGSPILLHLIPEKEVEGNSAIDEEADQNQTDDYKKYLVEFGYSANL